MAEILERELDQLQEVRCRRCGCGYSEHEDAGGHCRARLGGWSTPARGIPCPCPGFRWVDVDGPPVGSYRDEPAPIAPA